MVNVKKLDGSMQKYDASKLKRSLLNSGADNETAEGVVKKAEKILYEGIETRKLFKFVFKEFKKIQPYTALKYDLKNAILRLGPEGFVFEKFVSEILKKQGYSVKLNQIIKGEHIRHEIDIIAVKEKEKLMVESKYHTKPWLGCDIQTALYVYARFLDVKQHFTVPVLVTNTKFSRQVVDYAKGVGLWLMGWKFPQDNSVEKNIEHFKLYPITMLSMLSRDEAKTLLASNVILVKDLLSKDINEIAGILKAPKSKIEKILKQAEALVSSV